MQKLRIRKRKEKEVMKVRITFTEDVLGSQPSNPEIHAEFIAANASDKAKFEEEQSALPAADKLEKSITVFHRDPKSGKPALMDYQIRGFFKDSCSALNRVPGTKSKELKAYKKIIDGTIFVNPRFIPLCDVSGSCQRPLRGQTAQGERISLANSEIIPAGTSFEIEIVCLDPKQEAVVHEWLDYGKYKGIGQWRNSGKGRFSWQEIK